MSDHAARKVLVVEDDAALAKAIGRMLSGHKATTVTSGREAVTKLEHGERYDVILCDVMMPGMSGVEVFTEIEKIEADQAQRVVFMTGGAATAEVRSFLTRVARPTLDKPFDKPKLLALIAQLCP